MGRRSAAWSLLLALGTMRARSVARSLRTQKGRYHHRERGKTRRIPRWERRVAACVWMVLETAPPGGTLSGKGPHQDIRGERVRIRYFFAAGAAAYKIKWWSDLSSGTTGNENSCLLSIIKK